MCPAKPRWGPIHQHQANTNPALLAARTGNSCLVQAARERGRGGIVGQVHNGHCFTSKPAKTPGLGREWGRGVARHCHLEGEWLLHRNVEFNSHVWGAPGRKQKKTVRGFIRDRGGRYHPQTQSTATCTSTYICTGVGGCMVTHRLKWEENQVVKD